MPRGRPKGSKNRPKVVGNNNTVVQGNNNKVNEKLGNEETSYEKKEEHKQEVV